MLLCHLFTDGFVTHPYSLEYLAKIPLFNGRFAVNLFFILSGFALSYTYWSSGKIEKIFRLAAGRYFRLVIPIFAITIISYGLLKSEIIPLPNDRIGRLSSFLIFDPDILKAVKFALFDTFVNYKHSISYLPVLWTIEIEFIGSFVVFGLLIFFRNWQRKRWVYALIFLVLLMKSPYLSLFVIGLIIAESYVRGIRIPTVGANMLALTGLSITPFLTYAQSIPMTLAATAVFYGVLNSPFLKRFFENSASQKLGRISFSLYLTHALYLYICSGQVLRFVTVLANNSSHTAAFILSFIGIPICLLMATFFHPVDSFAVSASRYVGNRFLNSRIYAKISNFIK